MRHAIWLIVIPTLTILAGCPKNDGNKRPWRMFPKSNEQLMAEVTDVDPRLRREAVLELAERKAGKDSAALALYDQMVKSDPDPFVRAAAVTALGNLGNTEHIPALVHALEDPAEFVRWDAATALDRIVGPDALLPLITHARKDDSLDVRIAATHALRNYRDSRAVLTLADLMDDPDLSIRTKAHEGLVEIFGFDYGPKARDWVNAHRKEIPPEPVEEEEPSWWRRMRGPKSAEDDEPDDEPEVPDDEPVSGPEDS